MEEEGVDEGNERGMYSAREREEGGRGTRKGGKLQGRYPEEGTDHRTVYIHKLSHIAALAL